MISTIRTEIENLLGPIPEEKTPKLERACQVIAQRALLKEPEAEKPSKKRSFSEMRSSTLPDEKALRGAIFGEAPLAEERELAAYFGEKLEVNPEKVSPCIEAIFAERRKWKTALKDTFLPCRDVDISYSKETDKVTLSAKRVFVDFDSGIKTVWHSLPPFFVLKTHEYVVQNAEIKKEEAKRSLNGILVRPGESGAFRSLVFTKDGNSKVLQLFNRKKQGDYTFKGKKGSAITRAFDIETGGRFVSFCRSQSTPQAVENEINHLRFFQGKEGFSQLESVVKYPSKKDSSKEKTRIFIKEYEIGDLFNFFSEEKLRPRDKKDLVEQLISALFFMHENGRVHRDIKPENILVEHKNREEKSFVFADLELMKLSGSLSAPAGSAFYISPELGRHLFENGFKSKYTVRPSSDVWSLGVVFYLFILEERFNGLNEIQEADLEGISSDLVEFIRGHSSNAILFNLSRRKLPLLPERELSSPIQLVREMLDPNPSTRITASELKERLSLLDWEGFFRELRGQRS